MVFGLISFGTILKFIDEICLLRIKCVSVYRQLFVSFILLLFWFQNDILINSQDVFFFLQMKITQNSLLLFTQVFMQNTFLLTDKMRRCLRKLRNFLKVSHAPQFAVNIKLLNFLPRLSSFVIETKQLKILKSCNSR